MKNASKNSLGDNIQDDLQVNFSLHICTMQTSITDIQ